MEDMKLVALLKEHFPTKADMNERFTKVDVQLSETNLQFTELRREMHEGFSKMQDGLDDLAASAHALDGVLEQYPIERIERLEARAGLPQFVPASVDE